ncbi:MAG: Ribosomal large subunit pseudouridine synthase D [Phycisphaerae bacterium]|nr:Ribosomal large subunit pseudouridine synthase D [Phycisphaerae bacterium]
MADGDEEILAQEADGEDLAAEYVKLQIRRRLPGRRLDKYLQGRFARLSRTMIQKLIKQGSITVNGAPTKASYEMDGGDIIEMWIPPPEPTDITGEDIPLQVVYEDDHLLAINKLAGIICHPAKPSQGGTIANAVVFHCRGKVGRSDESFRPGIIHRLDKNTTGIMLIAKDDETLWRLSLQFERRTIEKCYLGIAQGELQLDQDLINAPLAEHPTIKDRYMVPGMRAFPIITKEAITHYKVLERFDGFTLVQMFPKTGRTHQLRVHMSFIGHPLVGDINYGGHVYSEDRLTGTGSTEPLLQHQALHAWKIKFVHPILEVAMELQAPPPPSFEHILHLLRTHRPRKKPTRR